MKLKFVLLLLITNSILFSNTNINKIETNLKSRITGKSEDIRTIAGLLWQLKYISSTTPQITITPQGIFVDRFGKVSVSDKRQLDILWNIPMENTNKSILKVNATLKAQLVRYAKPSKNFRFGLFGGIYIHDSEIKGSTLITWEFYSLWKLGLSVGVGYPGANLNISFRLTDLLAISIGGIVHFADSWILTPVVGINARIF